MVSWKKFVPSYKWVDFNEEVTQLLIERWGYDGKLNGTICLRLYHHKEDLQYMIEKCQQAESKEQLRVFMQELEKYHDIELRGGKA